MNQSYLAISSVQHFRYNDPPSPNITRFGYDQITTASDLLTLVIRTDSHFATRDLKSSFILGSVETTKKPDEQLHPAAFTSALEKTYKAWGESIVVATAESLDYHGRYGLPDRDTHHATNIHFHSADSLAGSVIRQTAARLAQSHGKDVKPLYISLDDMIHADVFASNSVNGAFGELGYSRKFSHDGEELDFIERPGHPAIECQIAAIRSKLMAMRGNNPRRVPIILLEDNVRRAKTLLWIIDKMEKGGIFIDGQLTGVATCFSVATAEERAKIIHENREIPLIVGVDYAESLVDVITPRDHLFDGFVIETSNGSLGRLPSFMFTLDQISKNFKILPAKATSFLDRVMLANQNFCKQIQQEAGVEPKLGWFTCGTAIAAVTDHSLDAPMRAVLKDIRNKRVPYRLHLVQD